MASPGLTYYDLVNHIVPGPQSLSYFAPFVLLPLALLAPRTFISHRSLCALVLPLIVASSLHAWLVMGGVDVISVDNLLRSFFLLAFKDPRNEFAFLVRKSPAIVPKHDKHAEVVELHDYEEVRCPPKIMHRLPWVGGLLVSLQLNNWKVNDVSHDKRQPARPSGKTHVSFIVFAFLRTAFGYMILDATAAYIRTDPYFHDLALPIDTPRSWPTGAFGGRKVAAQQQAWLVAYLLRTIVVAAQAWALISQQFHLPCVIPVALHGLGIISDTWAPHLWPPFFGPASSILTSGLRGFWGTYWHQTMRWTVAAPGYALSDWLRLPNRGTARYTLVACAAFLASGCVHMGLVPPQPLHASVSANRIRLLVAAFFWLQPVGILAELLVSKMARRALPASFRSSQSGTQLQALANVGWVTLWSLCVFPLLCEAGRQLGYFRHYTVPYSLVNGIDHGEWIMWDMLR